MKRIIIELYTKTCEPNRYFEVDIDGGKLFDYRARVSFGAFYDLVRHPERSCNEKLFYVERPLLKSEKDESVEVITVGSLWEFYKLIGYNYKTKKYEKI